MSGTLSPLTPSEGCLTFRLQLKVSRKPRAVVPGSQPCTYTTVGCAGSHPPLAHHRPQCSSPQSKPAVSVSGSSGGVPDVSPSSGSRPSGRRRVAAAAHRATTGRDRRLARSAASHRDPRSTVCTECGSEDGSGSQGRRRTRQTRSANGSARSSTAHPSSSSCTATITGEWWHGRRRFSRSATVCSSAMTAGSALSSKGVRAEFSPSSS
mmetsp:Transcript_13934/g.44786  ORF Transcript_13934/g.44786 Transcript_13934/m.44786 type:complete len:209 (-) Transcript_13934:54-680(-)